MPIGKYPRTEEWKQRHADALRRPHLSGPHICTDEMRKKIGAANRRGEMVPCCECGVEVYRHAYRLKTTKMFYCSRACESQSKSRWMKGPQSPAWDGGISKINERIRAMDECREWKAAVLHRDGFQCQGCGAHGVEFHVHHKNQLSVLICEFLEQYNQFSPVEDKEVLVRIAINHGPFWDVGNGVTLCIDCHEEQPDHQNVTNLKQAGQA